MSILLVEDEDDVREALSVFLECCGARVTGAASVRQALDLFVKIRPDVLVTDLAMPVENGFDLLNEVRRLEASREDPVPIIALTGFTGTEDVKQAISAGFKACLMKPMDPEKFAEVVSDLVGKPKGSPT